MTRTSAPPDVAVAGPRRGAPGAARRRTAAGLQAAALALAAPVPAEPGAVAELLATITGRAVRALGGRDGRLVLAEDAAWRDLVPGTGPEDGCVTLGHDGRLRRAPLRPDGATARVLATGESVYHPDTRLPFRYGPYPALAARGIRALVNVPLRASGQVVGVLGVSFAAPRPLREGDRDWLNLFAAHAAAALERARLVAAERRRALQTERLAHTLARVGAAPDLEAAGEALLRGAISLLGGDRGVVLIYAPLEGERPLVLAIDGGGRLRRPRLPVGGPSAAPPEPDAADAADPLDPAAAGGAAAARTPWDARAAVAVPIVADGQQLGSLHVYHRQADYFGPADLAMAEALAAQAGGAIQRARLEASRRRAEAARDAALHELAQRTEQLDRQYRRAEQAQSETRAILDAAGEAIVVVSPDRRIQLANRCFGEFFALDPAALIGHNYHEFEDHFRRVFAGPAAFAARLAGSADDAVRRFTLAVVQRWPEARELELESTPVHAPGGEFLGRLYDFRDATREHEIDRMKSEFVSLVSHELRTPLTSIKGYLDLVLEGALGDVRPEQREFLAIAKRNADRLAALVADILDLSRIEAGRLELHRTALDLGAVVAEAAAALRPLVTAKGQRLTLDVPADLPPVLGDGERVAQILTNLLSNAHKYTPTGGRIGVAARRDGARVRVEVRDTGIGLTAYERSRLFTRFYRARNPAAQEAGGTGLGLAITRQLVQLQGGTLTVASRPGRGSVFAFTLPLAPAPAAAQQQAGAAPGDVPGPVRRRNGGLARGAAPPGRPAPAGAPRPAGRA